MHANIANKIAGIADKTGLLLFYQNLISGRKNQVSILMYHRLTTNIQKEELDKKIFSASAKEFEKQITYLKKNYNVITFKDLTECKTKGKTLPKKSVIITFDDGYKDNYTIAFPILKKYNIPATIFLTTGHIGKKELFWWDKLYYILSKSNKEHCKIRNKFYPIKGKQNILRIQNILKRFPNREKLSIIKRLSKELNVKIPTNKSVFLSWQDCKKMMKYDMSFGPHTVSHPIMTSLAFLQAINEIEVSKKEIIKKLGRSLDVFAYPNGQNKDMDPFLDTYMAKNSFLFCLSTIYGQEKITKESFKLKRIGISHDDSFALFKCKLAGMGSKVLASKGKT